MGEARAGCGQVIANCARCAALTFLFAGSAFAGSVFAGNGLAQPAEVDPSSSESVTSAALRASLLGDSDRAREIVQARLEWESARRVKPEFVVSERLTILAESSRRWLPSDRIARQQLRGFPRSDASGAFRENLRGVEPREVLRHATATRVYESRRRAVNSTIGAFAGVLRLQFFGLVQLPLDAAESVVSGRPYLNPEQRRELRAARGVLLDRPSHGRATQLVERYEERRLRLAVHHAEANAERALDQGRLETAAWWVAWAETLSGGDWQAPDDLAQLNARIADVEQERTQSIFVREVPRDDREEAWLRWVLDSLDEPAEAEGRTPLRSLQGVELADDVRAAIIAVRRDPATPDATVQALGIIARSGHPAWSPRASGYLAEATFDPVRRVAMAQGDVRSARRDFVLWAVDPTVGTRTLSPEDARLAESKWIAAARSLFVIDMLGRLITLPLLPSGTFPRDALLDATTTAPAEFLATRDGESVRRVEARALSRVGRHGQAAAVWAELDEPARAEKSHARAARQLERLARDTPSASRQAAIYRRMISGWPGTSAARRSVGKLAEAQDQMAVLTVVSSDELLALAPAWESAGWQPPSDAAPNDGRHSTVRLLDDGTVQWRARDKDPWQATPVEDETFDRMTASLREVRLGGQIARALDEPREVKRVPLLLDASAIPGIDFTPGLVPADIPTAERRLYE